jgi:hypothetical protein
VANGPQLAALVFHDRIDSRLLLGAQAKLASKSVSEPAIPRAVRPWSMLEPMSLEFMRQQHPAIDRHSRKSPCHGHQQEHQKREQSSARAPG